MGWKKWFRRNYRVAVLGSFQSGKTVFTTALLNHIKHHDPNLLKVGRLGRTEPLSIVFDAESSAENKTSAIARFPYEDYRAMAAKKWPQKTKATSQYRCSFFRSDWSQTAAELLIVDVPGERYADIPMAKKTFAEWSDWLFSTVFPSKDNRTQTEDYVALVSSPNPSPPDVILESYKNTLAQLYKTFRPFVTPSTFLLAEDGTFHGKEIFMEGNYANAHAGLSEDLQFAPLPSSLKVTSPELYKSFADAFERYKKQIVSPLCETLASVNQLVVVVDITTLLAANTAMKNGSRVLLEEIVDVLSPGCSTWGRIGNTLVSYLSGGHFDGSGIERIAVVASKADKVLPADSDKLVNLLKAMVGSIFERHRHRASSLAVEYFTVAAAKSAKNVQGNEHQKRGTLQGDLEESVYDTSSLPDKWPGQWSVGEYCFPDIQPRFPDDEQQAPEHIGLEQIFNFLFDFK